MIATKNGKRINGIWAITCTLVFSIGIMVSLISIQEAYAEKKKITGTSKMHSTVARTQIPASDPNDRGWLIVGHSVLNSADPDWNNARYFYIVYSEPTKDYDYKGYGNITHPGGDQTFVEFKGIIASASGTNAVCDTKCFIIGGTGKFEGIRARISVLENWNGTNMENTTSEFEVAYH